MEKQLLTRQAVIYGATTILMIYTAYFHAISLARQIDDFKPADLNEVWPIYFLVIAILLFGISTMTSVARSGISAEVALVGVMFGMVYYLLSLYGLFVLMSVIMLIVPNFYLAYFLPIAFLVWSATLSYKVKYRL